MSTDADFLRAVLAEPDADAPRLAYADWLEESGDAARAEFIRVQCGLASLPEGDREWHPLRQHAEALLQEHRTAWLQPLRDLFQPPARPAGWRGWFNRPPELAPIWYAGFQRGFVEVLGIDPDALLRRADELTRLTPLHELILHVERTPDNTATLEGLLRCPHLSAVRRLALTTHRLRATEMRLLADAPHLTGLEALSLGCYGIDRAAVEALVGGRLLGRLESLEVRTFDAHDPPWADMLLMAPAIRGLTELSVMAFDAAGDLLPRLCQTPPFTRLTSLHLHQLALGDQSLGEFLAWLPPTLTHLGLAGTRLGDRAAASLARAPQLRQLRRLGLSQNRITDAGAMALADSPNLLAPTRLDLEGNSIGERVRNALRVRLGHQVEIDE